MSRELVVRRVELLGDDRSWSWSFERGVNVIVGPVGTGKTTLLNLVRFGLGGSWTPTKKARESAGAVRLHLRAHETWLHIRREFGANEATVTLDQEDERQLRLSNAPAGSPTLSDLLLGLLGLPNVKVPTSRAKAGKRKTSITFNDILTYLYLEQTEIDRQTARSEDRILGPKRLYVFELLYGLLDDAGARLQLEAGERADERQQLTGERRLLQGWAERYQKALARTLSIETSRAAYEIATRELAALEDDEGRASLEDTRNQLAAIEAESDAMQAELRIRR